MKEEMTVTDFELGNQLLAEGRIDEAISAFDRCLVRNPQDWQALSNRGNARLQGKQYDLALADYLQAAAINPAANSVKCNLAVLLKELGELALAEGLLREVLAADRDNADAWSNLGVVLQHRLQYPEAIAAHRQALACAGPSAARFNNLGNAYSCALQLDEAVKAYQHALQLAGDDPFARFNLSIVLFLQGRYQEAWPLYESRWDAILQPRYVEQRWGGQNLDGKTLLIWAEQGLGDTLQMVRFLPQLQQQYSRATILFAVPKTFLRLFGQLDGITLLELGATPPAYDWQLPLMSLPGHLGVTLDNLPTKPYLQALCPTSAMPSRRQDRLRVGIVWETGTWGVGIADHGRQNKSVPIDQFATLLARPDIEFVSLQLGDLPDGWRQQVLTFPISDFADTAAIISQLDLVISVDTSVVHLAGAMGKPVWVLMRAESAPFFMAKGAVSPWYPSMTIWRQTTPGDWTPVLQQVSQALEHFQPLSVH